MLLILKLYTVNPDHVKDALDVLNQNMETVRDWIWRKKLR